MEIFTSNERLRGQKGSESRLMQKVDKNKLTVEVFIKIKEHQFEIYAMLSFCHALVRQKKPCKLERQMVVRKSGEQTCDIHVT